MAKKTAKLKKAEDNFRSVCNCAATAAADAYTYYVPAADAGLERMCDKIVKCATVL